MKNLYRDMYGDPAKYAIPTGAYDEYIKTVKKDAVFVKAHQTDAKECTLRNAFQQAIQYYPDYFYRIALASDGIRKKDLVLIITKSKYDDALRSLERPHIYRENGQRMKALADRGVTVNELGGTCYISCKTDPKMFLGLQVLCSAPEGKYKYTNYLCLYYKGFRGDMPGIEDVKATMKKEHAASVDLLLKLFGGVRMKYRVKPLRSITSGHGWKLEYTLDGKRRICGLSNRAEIINPGKGDIQKCIAVIKIFRKDIL